MTIFDILRQHAQRQPQHVATVSPRHRLTTYRKLWSRIERATARLQGEWLIGAGDVVIYAGHSHADALVLWLSLARLSAQLLPLETAARVAQAGHYAGQSGAVLLLHDDELALPPLGQELAVHRLSAIIARPCDYHPHDCPEQARLPSLLVVEGEALQAYGIADLLGAPASEWSVDDTLFDLARLRGQILPALVQGLPLELD